MSKIAGFIAVSLIGLYILFSMTIFPFILGYKCGGDWPKTKRNSVLQARVSSTDAFVKYTEFVKNLIPFPIELGTTKMSQQNNS